jgi:hypothetical protein
MNEEEKAFPIELIVILIPIALINDIAEVFFDLLDFTGVGISGEAIMEPANLILDLFFTGIFWWRVGFGGFTVTQYIGDLLEPLLIPGRTISVGLGIWLANHPNSVLGNIATEAAQLEGGEAGALNEAEGAAGKVGAEAEAVSAEGKLQGEAAGANGERAGETGESKSNKKGGSSTDESESAATEGENEGEGGDKKGEGESNEDEMESPEERDPIKGLEKQLEEPSDEEFPGQLESDDDEDEDQEEAQAPRKVIDISSRRKQPSPKRDEEDDSLEKAA